MPTFHDPMPNTEHIRFVQEGNLCSGTELVLTNNLLNTGSLQELQ